MISVLVMWTAFASVFSLTLGYSRVPYAAALDGNYFRAFARVHPVHQFPYVSLLALAGVAALFCFLRLADLIAALVVIRIMLQFLVQTIGRDCASRAASGFGAAVSDVALSGSGAGGGGEFSSLFWFRAGIFCARFATRSDSDGRGRDLLCAGLAAPGVAVWGAVVGRWSLVVSHRHPDPDRSRRRRTCFRSATGLDACIRERLIGHSTFLEAR